MGVAAAMKITAWPLAALCLLVVPAVQKGRTLGDPANSGGGYGAPQADVAEASTAGPRPARLLYSFGVASVVVPVLVPFFVADPAAFIENVIKFPLGLTDVSSPAASALPGHLIAVYLPHAKHLVTLALAVGVLLAIGTLLVARTPRTPAAAARFIGFAMTAAIVLAPATRIGYLLYPVDLLVWAWVLERDDLVGTEGPLLEVLPDPSACSDPVAVG